MLRVSSAPIIVVKTHASVRDCILEMQESQSSYAVIENDLEQVVGIFTDRDVLRLFFLLRDERLDAPITSVMTSPVKMLPIQEMDRASELMQEKNIRHVPIFEQVDGHNKLIGVVTLAQLARQALFKRKSHAVEGSANDQSLSDQKIALVSGARAGQALKKLIEQVTLKRGSCEVYLGGVLEGPDNRKMLLHSADIIILDLDEMEGRAWANFIKDWNSSSVHPRLILLLQPSRHPGNVFELLKGMAKRSGLSVYTKPVDLGELGWEFSRRLAEKDESLVS